MLIALLYFSTLINAAADSLMDAAVEDAIRRFNARDYNPFVYEELGRTLDDEHGGAVYLAPISRETGELYPGVVDWLVITRRGGVWQALLPGDTGYRAALESLPPEVAVRLDDTRYRPQADPALVRSAEIAGYQLPWENGRWATVTRSFRQHGRGRADFDVSGAGTITAAKDGRIVYANDSSSANTYSTNAWWHWNTVIIQHGEHEYSLYGHLAPGSIPAWISDLCSDDYSQPNCDVPVQAGEVIGVEGSTGYSSSPHLHVEFGQGFGVIGYAAAPGVVTYAGYIYAEHNVGFSGYAPPEVASWTYGKLVQAAHHPAPTQAELVTNGGFDEGTSAWTPSGQVSWRVEDGVMRFLRLNTSEPPSWASFYQDLGVSALANAVFEARFSLGNISTYPKTISVTLSNAAGRDYGAVSCEYVVPANTPLQPYIMRARAGNTWANTRLEFGVNPPDSLPAALVDDISVQVIGVHAADDLKCDAASES